MLLALKKLDESLSVFHCKLLQFMCSMCYIEVLLLYKDGLRPRTVASRAVIINSSMITDEKE